MMTDMINPTIAMAAPSPTFNDLIAVIYVWTTRVAVLTPGPPPVNRYMIGKRRNPQIVINRVMIPKVGAIPGSVI